MSEETKKPARRKKAAAETEPGAEPKTEATAEPKAEPRAEAKAEPRAEAKPKRSRVRTRARARAEEREPGTIDVVSAENKKVREIQLHPEVFGVKVNEHLLYEAVKQYRAGARAGTHMTKNRALVSGSGRKPWRQKGTGRARVGEIRTPLWRHGGTVFGPTPRDYSYSMPKKARAAALRSALSQRVKEGALKVVDRFGIEEPKTKQMKGLLEQLGVNGKTVLVENNPGQPLLLAGRNIPDLKIVDSSHLSAYDVLDCRTLLVSQEALGKLEERLQP
jgi:large subunit ribosomal protein L4